MKLSTFFIAFCLLLQFPGNSFGWPPHPLSVDGFTMELIIGRPAEIRIHTYLEVSSPEDLGRYDACTPDEYQIFRFNRKGRITYFEFSDKEVCGRTEFTGKKKVRMVIEDQVERAFRQDIKIKNNTTYHKLTDKKTGSTTTEIQTFTRDREYVVSGFFDNGVPRAASTVFFYTDDILNTIVEEKENRRVRYDKFEYLEFDDRGNWTKRLTHRYPETDDNEQEYILTFREIDYY